MAGMSITPDTTDRTRGLERPLPECGFDPSARSLADLPAWSEVLAPAWSQVLARGDAVVDLHDVVAA